jgi:hypothetical protein
VWFERPCRAVSDYDYDHDDHDNYNRRSHDHDDHHRRPHDDHDDHWCDDDHDVDHEAVVNDDHDVDHQALVNDHDDVDDKAIHDDHHDDDQAVDHDDHDDHHEAIDDDHHDDHDGGTGQLRGDRLAVDERQLHRVSRVHQHQRPRGWLRIQLGPRTVGRRQSWREPDPPEAFGPVLRSAVRQHDGESNRTWRRDPCELAGRPIGIYRGHAVDQRRPRGMEPAPRQRSVPRSAAGGYVDATRARTCAASWRSLERVTAARHVQSRAILPLPPPEMYVFDEVFACRNEF